MVSTTPSLAPAKWKSFAARGDSTRTQKPEARTEKKLMMLTIPLSIQKNDKNLVFIGDLQNESNKILYVTVNKWHLVPELMVLFVGC